MKQKQVRNPLNVERVLEIHDNLLFMLEEKGVKLPEGIKRQLKAERVSTEICLCRYLSI